MRLVVLAFVVVVFAAATAAAAEDDGDVSVFVSKPTAVYAIFGLGTPSGWIGAEVERTLEPHWTISAGAGWGLGGPQASAMTHLLLGGSRRSRFMIGGGISGGKYEWKEFCIDCDAAQKTGSVMWGNLEIGGEHRFASGFAIKYFGGYGHIVAGDLVCDGDTVSHCLAYHANDGYNIIYTGVAIGGAF